MLIKDVLGMWSPWYLLWTVAVGVGGLRDHDEFRRRADHIISQLVMEERQLRKVPGLFRDVTNTVRKILPNCRVEGYGSITSGLTLRDSDVDLTVLSPRAADAIAAGEEATLLVHIAFVFNQHPHLFTDVRNVTNEKIKIVKCVHAPSGIHIDLILNQLISVQTSAMIRYLMMLDRRAYQMAILLKRWAKIRNIKKRRVFTQYNLLLLIIFYLQQEGVLPPVSLLQKNTEPYYIGEWNAAFREVIYNTNNNKSLYRLLGGFFQYYSTFDYEKYVISVFTGYPVEKTAFQHLDKLPAELALYKHNVVNNISVPLDLTGNFTLIECYEFNRKVAEYVNKIEEFYYFADVFKHDDGNQFLDILQ